jgi:hypothetical protein
MLTVCCVFWVEIILLWQFSDNAWENCKKEIAMTMAAYVPASYEVKAGLASGQLPRLGERMMSRDAIC